MKKYIIFILMLAMSVSSYSQTLEVKGVNTENYPELKLSVVTKDAAGQKVKYVDGTEGNYNIDVYELDENGNKIPRDIKEVICNQDVAKFNLMIVLDITQSMELNMIPGTLGDPGVQFVDFPERRIDRVMEIVTNLLQEFVDNQNEHYSIVSFANAAYTKVEWTKDILEAKDYLKKNIQLYNLTDYNMAFVGKNTLGQTSIGNGGNKGGALEYAKSSPNGYKPILLFFTDGSHRDGPSDILVEEIKDSAAVSNSSIYFSSFLPGAIPTEVTQIATGTGGRAESVETENEIQAFFQTVLSEVALNPTVNPCQIVYDTDCDYGNVYLEMNDGTTVWSPSNTFNYKSDVDVDTQVPKLIITDINKLNDAGEYDITVEAVNRDVKIVGYVADPNLHFEPIILPADGNTIRAGNANAEVIKVKLTGSETEAHCLEQMTFLTESPLFSCDGNTFEITAEFITASGKNVGNTTINTPITAAGGNFCNYSCNAVTITNAIFKSGDNEFVFKSPGTSVNSNECKDLNFTFNPQSDGSKSAVFTLKTTNGDYDITVTGGGSGLPDIAASPLDMGNIDCRTSTFPTKTLPITNPGLADLTITDISFDAADDIDFDVTVSGGFPAVVTANGGTIDAEITFNSAVDGNKNAKLIILSDADGKNNFQVDISGIRNSIAIDVANPNIFSNPDEINLGNVCINSDVALPTIQVQNTGNTDFDFSIDNPNSDFSTVSNLSLTNGATNNLDVILKGQAQGQYSGVLDIVDGCGTVRSITVLANFVDASVNRLTNNTVSSDFNVALVGATIDYVIENHNQTNLVASFDDDQTGKFSNIDVNPKSANVGETVTISFDYTPTDFDESTAVVRLEGSTCLSVQLDLIGLVGKKTAEFQSATEYKGRIGELIEVDFTLKKTDLNSSSVDFDVEYDGSIISLSVGDVNTSVFTLGNSSTVGDMITQEVMATVSSPNDEIYSLPFVALPGSADMVSPMNFSEPANKINPFILLGSGSEYKVVKVEADIPLTDYNVTVGDIFSISLNATDVNNFDAFNETINGEMKFNGTVISPYGDTPKSEFDSEMNKTIPFSIPYGETIEYQFRATTGNSEFTTIEVITSPSPKSTVGEVEFPNLTPKTVTINGLCPDGKGGYRLFDPSISPLTQTISPNPSMKEIKIDINIQEKGYHKVWISDMQGKEIEILENNEMVSGQKNYKIDINKLNAGSYLLIIEAPSEVKTSSFNIVK